MDGAASDVNKDGYSPSLRVDMVRVPRDLPDSTASLSRQLQLQRRHPRPRPRPQDLRQGSWHQRSRELLLVRLRRLFCC